MKPLAIVTEDLASAPLAWLGERCRVVCASPGKAAWSAAAPEAAALIVRTYTRVDEALLRELPALRVVARAGVGLDNVDLEACRARSIPVVHTPDANTRAVVEFVLACMLDVLRPREAIVTPTDLGAWQSLRSRLTAPRQLAGLTLGILGLGRIGSQVARAAAAIDMRVLYHDLREIPPAARFGAEPALREQVLREADIVSIHVDGRPENRGLIGAAECGLLRADVVLLNTSRGFVVDSNALAAFLHANRRARAVLDVHEPEPIEAANPLLGLPNATLTPHIASATAPAKEAMSWVVRDVWRVLCGEEPECAASAG